MAYNKKIIIIASIIALVAAAAVWYYFDKIYESGETVPTGTLVGHVTVGPICPVERVNSPCPVPPEAYTSREVIVYQIDGKTVVTSQHFDQNGNYQVVLPAGQYIVDISRIGGLGFSKDLPKEVIINSGQITRLDFGIDTGIR